MQMLIFLYGLEEKWMKKEQVSTLKHIQTYTDIISLGDPVSAQIWKEPLMVGAQLL